MLTEQGKYEPGSKYEQKRKMQFCRGLLIGDVIEHAV